MLIVVATHTVVLDWPCHSGWGPAAAILRFRAKALTLVRLVQTRGGAAFDGYVQPHANRCVPGATIPIIGVRALDLPLEKRCRLCRYMTVLYYLVDTEEGGGPGYFASRSSSQTGSPHFFLRFRQAARSFLWQTHRTRSTRRGTCRRRPTSTSRPAPAPLALW